MSIKQALKNLFVRKLTKDNLKAIEAEQDRIVLVTEYLQSELTFANEAIEKHRLAELSAIAAATNALHDRTTRLTTLTSEGSKEDKKLIALATALDKAAIASFEAAIV